MISYMDYAATSMVRPPRVAEAMTEYLRDCGATPGRGGHRVAVEAGRVVLRCRRLVQELLHLPGDPGRVAFAANATQALNTALFGILAPDDAVVVTRYDHNAVLRPVAHLARTLGVEVRLLSGTPDGEVDYDEAERALRGARVLVVNSASNVIGTRVPLAPLADRARDAGALVLVDAAQGAGHIPMRPADEGADLVAFTGHKGMLGPQGTGGLWVREGIEVGPLIHGGTGGNSMDAEMPAAMPDRLEAGSLNGPGLAGLAAGLEEVVREGVDGIHARESALKKRLRDGLMDIPEVRVLTPAAPDGVGIVCITTPKMDPATMSHRLDREWGVLTRSGLHCAPEAHRVLGTLATGTLRLSVGWGSTEEHVDHTLEAVTSVLQGSVRRSPTPPRP
ncbi:MAG: aminotransferase class V-fold PLP-dependent enzyme [Gemmatimonadota bacterium]|nr:aminotransferase class V-fold PLP-dependent enzyme [Gemmatimonadota bacterium]MDH5758602.1 aminotransferase class V-fold PLP-dependent enzyme [Gemmatimonadota bacterium]